uniref:Peptidase S1 domain-containing protein n=1 Tax=Graphocephala atropunctata TaxID=36148 RepID=A0A1B6LTT1_9HEMI
MRVGALNSVLMVQLAVVSCFRQHLLHKLKYEKHPNWKLLPFDECGRREGFDHDMAEEGVAGLGQHPWIAAIMLIKKSAGTEEYQCSGSIINDRYILTAAHCVHPKLRIKVRLGEHTHSTYVDCRRQGDKTRCAPPREDEEVEKVILHPQYYFTKDQYRANNDIALVRLKRPIDGFNDYIRPICLPTFASHMSYVGQDLEVAGWGKTGSGRNSDQLHTVKVPVISEKECVSIWGEALVDDERCQVKGEEWCQVDIGDNEICAGGEEGKGVKKGYSGGPLMTSLPVSGVGRIMFIVGVVSYGVEKPDRSSFVPDVYMRVSKYMDWILDEIYD